ncbi:MAG: dynamin family protein [Kineosporiaceae bacterium]
MAQQATKDSGTDRIAAARAAVDHGMRACAAYRRPDLRTRLSAELARLDDPGTHVVVVGEFKQGKSSLVNALVGAGACAVDDDVATAVPTYLRHGKKVQARLLLGADPPTRRPLPPEAIREHTVEGGVTEVDGQPVVGVEVLLPRNMLASGLVIVDTPGLGGLGSSYAAASLTAAALADAVVFVTDASQELTATEVAYLNRARELCDTVICALTKIDFYPAWRTVRDLDRAHLDRLGMDKVRLLPVSSSLRTRAVRTNDQELNAESGFRDLVRFVSDEVGVRGAAAAARNAGAELAGVCDQLIGQFDAERSVLADPDAARAVVDELEATRHRADSLREAAARWNQTLGDGISDLSADIDHDLKSRFRLVLAEADEAIEDCDPADTWTQLEPWLRARVSHDLVTNYTMLRDRAAALSTTVAEHFRDVSGTGPGRLAVYDPTPLVDRTDVDPDIALEKMSARKQGLVALRNSYSGILMFTMLPTMVGLTGMAPIAVPIGLLMGRAGLREEKKRQLKQRQGQAKNAVRHYCDEVQFLVGKDSRDTLRRIQRQLRDHYGARAEELRRSVSEALNAANAAAKRSSAERERRLKDLDAELDRLRQLRRRAEEVQR